MTEEPERGGERRIEHVLGVAGLLLLLLGCFFVMRPFLSALMWAIVLCYSLWPLQARFTKWFRGSRTFAALLVTLTLTIVSVGPFVLIGFSIADDAKALVKTTRRWVEAAPDAPPEWMKKIPLVGDEMANYWKDFAADRSSWVKSFDAAAAEKAQLEAKEEAAKEGADESGHLKETPPAPPEQITPVAPDATAADQPKSSNRLLNRLARQLGQASTSFTKAALGVGSTIGQGIMEVLLSVFFAFFLLRDGGVLGERLSVGMKRIAGDRGRHLIHVAGGTVRGVVYGILGTALVQAVVAGIGFSIAGVPAAVLLAVMTFLFSPVPIGPPLVWVPATIWLFTQGSAGWGIFMAIWGIFGISGVDNIVKPYLISHESKTPFVLIFCGVIGGALAFGLVGIFLGPTLLAVTFRLIEEWSANRARASAMETLPGGP